MRVEVIVPVLGRPHRVAGLLASLRAAATEATVSATFVCSAGDTSQIEACRAARATVLVVAWEPGHADYAMKVNAAFAQLDADFALLGADDLAFRDRWADRAIGCHERTGACVIGTNDLSNSQVRSGQHSTHPLVHRDYADCGTIDEDGKILCDLYDHNWVDRELVETAKWWGTWAFAGDAVVEHLHPDWRKAEDDATYRKGRARFNEDRALFEQRKHLWGGR